VGDVDPLRQKRTATAITPSPRNLTCRTRLPAVNPALAQEGAFGNVKEGGAPMHVFTKPSIGARMAAATILGALILAGPVIGPRVDAHAAAKGKGGRGDEVESRIKTLHSELHITAAQEAAWNNVAQVMRDNAKTMSDLRAQQAESEKTASAPDVLNAYAKTIDAHGEGVHKFIPVFQTLYDSMSDAQKKTADGVFRKHVHAAAARHKS
jgi:hypothetical protein